MSSPKIAILTFLLLLAKLSFAQKINDNFFISGSNGNGGTTNRVAFSSIAYNTIEDEYLVVWAGEYDGVTGLATGEPEIWGQLIDAAADTLIGNNFRISSLGANEQADVGVNAPKVVHNPTYNEYLVVFYGDDNRPPIVNGEAEIYGQRLDADGNEIGENDFRISIMGDDNEPIASVKNKSDANFPDVVYNSTNDEYMVVWHGDNVDKDFEVWGQRLRGIDGAVIDTNYQISYVDTDFPFPVNPVDPVPANIKPSICWNSQLNEYLVTWHGGTFFPNARNEYQIYGQRVDSTGFLIDTSFQISNSIGNLARGAYTAYNEDRNEYLTIWVDRANSNQFLVKGQLLDSIGVNIDTVIDISTNGEDQFRGLDTQSAEAHYDSLGKEYVVIWSANVDTSNDTENSDYQVHFIALDDSTGQVIDTAFIISDLGGNIDNNPSPALAYRSLDRSYFAVWSSNIPIPVDSFEAEIRGQHFETLNNQCIDGVLNGDEEGVDCGGSCPNVCMPTCDDGIQNGDETGVDCGGSCPNMCCTIGEICDDGDANTINDTLNMDCVCVGVSIARLNAKIFLQGAYQDT
ncbi:MAG: hypothetical protein AAF599_00255, partial [Bacteroidota bacterium]